MTTPEGEQAPSTPAHADTLATGDSTTATAGGPTTQGAQERVEDEATYWAWLERQDPTTLIKRHRALAGKVGELSDKEYQKRRQRETEEERRRQEVEVAKRKEQELEDALEHDPYKATDLIKEQRAQEKRRQEAEAQRRAVLGEWDARIERLFHNLPDEVKTRLSGKQYAGEDEYAARTSFLEDIIEGLADHKGDAKALGRLKEEKKRWEQEWEKERRPAIQQDALGDLHRDAPSPDMEGGAAPRGELTWEDFQANRTSATWRRENRDSIDRLLAKMARVGAAPRG